LVESSADRGGQSVESLNRIEFRRIRATRRRRGRHEPPGPCRL